MKFKPNDIVMLINKPDGSRTYWGFLAGAHDLQFQLGVVISCRSIEKIVVQHTDASIAYPFVEHPDELVKIGVL